MFDRCYCIILMKSSVKFAKKKLALYFLNVLQSTPKFVHLFSSPGRSPEELMHYPGVGVVVGVGLGVHIYVY